MQELDRIFYDIHNAKSEFLEKSVSDCHFRGIHSIVVGKNEFGGLIRYFVSDIDFSSNCKNMMVGPHDHHYDISLTPVIGKLTNITFDEHDNPNSNVSKFEFSSDQNHNKTVKRIGSATLSVSSSVTLIPNQAMFLKNDVIHTVEFSGLTIWKVEERQFVKNTSRLFSIKSTEEITSSTKGLYTKIENPLIFFHEYITTRTGKSYVRNAI